MHSNHISHAMASWQLSKADQSDMESQRMEEKAKEIGAAKAAKVLKWHSRC